MLIGYARVSTDEQDTRLQLDALKRAGVERIYQDTASGVGHRPQLLELLGMLRPGDTVITYKLDRIGRSLVDLLGILARIERAGAVYRSLTETIDTSTAPGRMMMQMIGAFAEFERSIIVERTRAGVRAAMDRGVRVGRPRALSTSEEAECLRLFANGTHTKSSLARRYGCDISSIKRVMLRAAAF